MLTHWVDKASYHFRVIKHLFIFWVKKHFITFRVIKRLHFSGDKASYHFRVIKHLFIFGVIKHFITFPVIKHLITFWVIKHFNTFQMIKHLITLGDKAVHCFLEDKASYYFGLIKHQIIFSGVLAFYYFFDHFSMINHQGLCKWLFALFEVNTPMFYTM